MHYVMAILNEPLGVSGNEQKVISWSVFVENRWGVM